MRCIRRHSTTTPSSCSVNILDLSKDHLHIPTWCRNQSDLSRVLGPDRLRSSEVRRCFARVDRALFLPSPSDEQDVYYEPYSNAPQPLCAEKGATLSAPTHHANLLNYVWELVLGKEGEGGNGVETGKLGRNNDGKKNDGKMNDALEKRGLKNGEVGSESIAMYARGGNTGAASGMMEEGRMGLMLTKDVNTKNHTEIVSKTDTANTLKHEKPTSTSPEITLLDIGCGTGWTVAAFYDLALNKSPRVKALGVERNATLITNAKESLTKCPVTNEAFSNGNIKVENVYSSQSHNTWNVQTLDTFAPYDLIHVGFAFASLTDQEMIVSLTTRLKPTGKLLCGVDTNLCLLNKTNTIRVLEEIPGMAQVKRGVFVPSSRVKDVLKEIKIRLDDWKLEFENRHGKKPTKTDLFADPYAKKWFEEFAKYSSRA